MNLFKLMKSLIAYLRRNNYVPISQHIQEKNKKRRPNMLSVCRALQKSIRTEE